MPNKYFDKKIKRIELPSKESSKSYKMVVEKEKSIKGKKRKRKYEGWWVRQHHYFLFDRYQNPNVFSPLPLRNR